MDVARSLFFFGAAGVDGIDMAVLGFLFLATGPQNHAALVICMGLRYSTE